ncbi:TetR/AcrR family transcriptional regulator [Gluconacetobacter sacchari]|uniref:TetR/AcrR family transcriptional regulator n=1 Tax=Gluconacetobacter sacchari TaxID=92759 RepID=UPI00278C0DFB|nr:TetR/AcrR family transcriptional regulator [Gluconacetobacter sacchari]
MDIVASRVSGRPRRTEVSVLVRQAALELAYEHGIGHATIENIAQRSGAAKSTIYRRWPNSASVLMDAFLSDISQEISYKDLGSVTATFRHALFQLVTALSGKRRQLLRNLLGMAQMDEELSGAFWERWIQPRRNEGIQFLKLACQRGEIGLDCDVDLVLDMLFGAVYYRFTIPYRDIDESYIDALVENTFRGLLIQPS